MKQQTGSLTSNIQIDPIAVSDTASSPASTDVRVARYPRAEDDWQKTYSDRLGRIISCYQTPAEQRHAALLSAETERVVEQVKSEVAHRGVDWRTVPPPRPLGVDSGGVVLAWDEPTWGAEIEIEISHGGGPAEVFIWADRKASSEDADAGGIPLEEHQDIYHQLLIQLLCGEATT